MRPVLVRSLAVLGVGLVILAGILYYASTVDGRPPVVERIGLTQHQPADDHVALTTTSIEVTFSEDVREEGAQGAFRIDPQVAGEYAWAGTTMTFTPTQRLPLRTSFRVWVAAGVRDTAGNAMDADSAAFEFTTVGPPMVVQTDPADGADQVSLDAPITITFSVLMDTASVEQALRVSPGANLEASWEAEQLVLTPTDGLAEATTYSVTIGTGARDSTGEPLADTYRFSFTTTRSPLAPSLLVPADETDGVAVTTPLAIFFDREVDAGSLDGEALTIEPQVAGNLELISPPGAAGLRDGTRRVVRFQPSAPLEPNTTYHVVFNASLAGTDGSELSTAIEWSFTTGSPLATLSNQVVFLSERAGVANLWAMNPDGSAQRQLSSELSPVTDYAVAPDGRSYLVADGAVLVLQDANGAARQLLTEGDALEYDPTWAPDGGSFAFGRSDRQTGEGRGLWLRDASGGNERQLELPPGSLGRTSPTPSPSAGEEPAGILLRAPRFSPDGGALAFVDLDGWAAIVELPSGRLASTPAVAVAPPVWLRDSTGVLITTAPGSALGRPLAGRPLDALSPANVPLDDVRLASLGISLLDRGATAATPLDLGAGASRPAVSRQQLAFIRVDPGDPQAGGELWLSQDVLEATDLRRLLADGGAPVVSATFGVDAESLLVARSGGAVWLVDTVRGEGLRLAPDGWLPRWLP